MWLLKVIVILYPREMQSRLVSLLETHPERPFLANDDIENKGLLGREIAKKRLSGFVSRSPSEK
jgi:hypothetical protein